MKAYTLLTAVSLLLFVTTDYAPVASARTPPQCADGMYIATKNMLQILTEEAHETDLIWFKILHRGRTVALVYANPVGGTWSGIVSNIRGNSCLYTYSHASTTLTPYKNI